MQQYNKYLRIIEKEFGHNKTTNNIELDNYCTAVFGNNKYKGAVAKDRIPVLKNHQCCIFNKEFRPPAVSPPSKGYYYQESPCSSGNNFVKNRGLDYKVLLLLAFN